MPKIVLNISHALFIIGISFCLLLCACNNYNNKIESINNDAKDSITIGNPSEENISLGQKVDNLDRNIRSIYQDKKGNFWFGTNNSGVFRFNGKELRQFTESDGLTNNQVLTIHEDSMGNIWFGTGIFGVCSFDGNKFTTHTTKENLETNNHYGTGWDKSGNDLWFYAGAGTFRYSDKNLIYLPFHKSVLKLSQNAPFELSPYAVYSILTDKKGNIWFGTQSQGVCRYDGKDFTWFTDHGLAGPAVLALFEDSRGNIWMGNNGAGLFKYEGKTVINMTEKHKLNNPSFRTAGNDQAGTLARIYAINEDLMGNIWIGTVDAGVWKYDGNSLTNYSNKEGLTSQAINTIYRDKIGNLWFGSDADGIFKFNGLTFEQINLL
jgi:ligand-binding sensor domain-containing protein